MLPTPPSLLFEPLHTCIGKLETGVNRFTDPQKHDTKNTELCQVFCGYFVEKSALGPVLNLRGRITATTDLVGRPDECAMIRAHHQFLWLRNDALGRKQWQRSVTLDRMTGRRLGNKGSVLVLPFLHYAIAISF